ncbi:MAG: hypothetical protein ACRDEA_00125, partial [Microcystaceae cyanobacterium]
PQSEIFRGEETGMFLVPIQFRDFGYTNAFFKTNQSHNNYNVPTTYIEYERDIEEKIQILTTIQRKLEYATR